MNGAYREWSESYNNSEKSDGILDSGMDGSSLVRWRFLNLPQLALAAQHGLLYVGPLGGHYDVATTVYKPRFSVQLTFKANNCRP